MHYHLRINNNAEGWKILITPIAAFLGIKSARLRMHIAALIISARLDGHTAALIISARLDERKGGSKAENSVGDDKSETSDHHRSDNSKVSLLSATFHHLLHFPSS
ncbi:hypothetical protein LOAG_08247 [Loa loa]|uniref:Uncharacterized protein n=1 Tax=Loa loa TaxID=7209 RepID=A0A1S0TU47_LOALO|nr:hypothetical protein LOAG_08247 [Loa loa]EFO20243.1 hypothetical protein LOAG_08247 [Loa loa]